MMDNQPIIPASQSQSEVPPELVEGLVEGDFDSMLGRNREKSPFDRLRMISRYARLSNL